MAQRADAAAPAPAATDVDDDEGAAPPAAGQDFEPTGPAAAAAARAQIGKYGGVVPGDTEAKRAAAHRARAGGPPVVGWIGFQPLEAGRSRVFVQLSRDAQADQELVGNTLMVTVAGARLGSTNSRRPLDTRFFDTAVAMVTPKRVGRQRARKGRAAHAAGVQLAIEFKQPGDARAASVRTTLEPDGHRYLFIDFEPGTAPKPDPGAALRVEQSRGPDLDPDVEPGAPADTAVPASADDETPPAPPPAKK
jgi:hypothetical protein